MLARTAATTAPAGSRAPEDAGVDALRAGIAAATAGGGTRVRLARLPWAGEGGPASAVVLDPASTAGGPGQRDGVAAPAPRPDDSDRREVAEMIAALPQAAAALRSRAAVARTIDARPVTGGRAAAAPAPRLGPSASAADGVHGAAQARKPGRTPGRTPGRDVDNDRDIDALYDRLAARLRADLLDDRERRGDHLGRWLR